MFTNSLLTLFFSGLGLGLIHAFDSDHLVALSNLTSHRPNLKKTLAYSLHWAMGHGLVLVILGLYASYLGLNIPILVAYWGELLVGLMLILLGGWTFYQLYAESYQHQPDHQVISNRRPLLVGIVHGSAGSATVLALIPAIQLGRPLITLMYIIFFAIGVLLSMSLFTVIFSHSQQKIAKYSHNVSNALRAFIAMAAIILGLLWLLT